MLGLSWLELIKDSVKRALNRTLDAPSRALTLPVLELYRDDMQYNISRFLDDVFVYLNERGEKENPGPIISTVLKDAPDIIPTSH